MPLPATALTAAPLALLFLALSLRVVGARRRHRAALGAPNREVERAVRAHGNFAEYAPFALLLLALLEGLGAPAWAVGALGAALVAGRLLHAAGIAREPEDLRWRVAGMALTFGVIALAALALPVLALFPAGRPAV